jgi:hypothetical protein
MSFATTSAKPAGREEEFAFLFAQLILQQSNMAMMLMGKVAHPASGQVIKDIEAARLFIDQLEMLEVKTKGNLSKEEEALLKQTLMNLRLNFVQAVETPAAQPSPENKTAETPSAPSPAPATAPDGSAVSSEPAPSTEEEHRKKFSKKY